MDPHRLNVVVLLELSVQHFSTRSPCLELSLDLVNDTQSVTVVFPCVLHLPAASRPTAAVRHRPAGAVPARRRTLASTETPTLSCARPNPH